MISVGRQQMRASGYDTPFAPGSPFFIAAPAQAIIRRESLPPFIRKRIGFQQIKVLPFRWPTMGGPGGLSLYGAMGPGAPNWTTLVIIGLALYGGYVIWTTQIRRRRR